MGEWHQLILYIYKSWVTRLESKLHKEIDYRDRKILQVKNQECSLIMDVGGILSEWPQASRKHSTEEWQANVAHIMEDTAHTGLLEAGERKGKSKRETKD